MPYTLTYTGQFKKDLKRCKKRGLNLEQNDEELTLMLLNTGTHSDIF